MKQIHWQLPFSSLDGNDYRIDIYADGEVASPVILTGAAEPFTTDDDNSDDHFESVRGGTGMIHIVNKNGELELEDLQPKSDIDKPVRVLDAVSGDVVWQGFLSSRLYSQDYTVRPHTIDLPVMSLLSAMDSVEVSDSLLTSYGQNHIPLAYILWSVLTQFMTDAGVDGWIDRVSYPESGRSVLMLSPSQYVRQVSIDPSNFFSADEVSTTGGTDIQPSGISICTAISYISSMMGWCAMEDKNVLRFIPLQGWSDMYEEPLSHFSTATHTGGLVVSRHTKPMSDLEYRGTDHTGNTMSVDSAKKAVNVVAQLGSYENGLTTPVCPIDNTGRIGGSIDNDAVYVSLQTDYYSNIHFNHFRTRVIISSDYNSISCGAIEQVSSSDDNLQSILTLQNDAPSRLLRTSRNEMLYAGGFHAKLERDGGGKQIHSYKDGFKLNLLPHLYGEVMPPAVVISSALNVSIVEDSYLHINADLLSWGGSPGNIDGYETHLVMRLRIGNKYYDYASGNWVDNPSYFLPRINGDHLESNWDSSMHISEVDGYVIRMNEELTGRMVLEIYPTTWKDSTAEGRHETYTAEIGFAELKVEQLFREDRLYNDVKQNRYRKLLGVGGREEYTHETHIASDMKNAPSPSIISDRFGYIYKIQTILFYNQDGSSYESRPEDELLEKLSKHYSSPRRNVELRVKSTNESMRLLALTGFDGKTYLPLSESRYWRNGVSTIKCFEVPEGNL